MFKVVLSLVTIVSFVTLTKAQSGTLGTLTSFTDSSGLHVYYLGVDSHVHQLWEQNGYQWPDENLTAEAGGPLAKGFFTSFSDATGEHVYYVGEDSHVHQLCWNGYTEFDQDLTAGTVGAIPVQPNTYLTSFSDVSGRHVYYIGNDFHIHQLYWNWRGIQEPDEDLTIAAHALLACASLSGLSDASGEHVYYFGCVDWHVHQLLWNGQELDRDLTEEAGGPQVALNVSLTSFSDVSGEHVYYVDRNYGHIHQLWNNGSQQPDEDLTQAAGTRAPGAPWSTNLTGFSDASGEHVYYLYWAGVFQAWWNGWAEALEELGSTYGGAWQCHFNGSLTSLSVGTENLYYIREDDAHVHKLYWNGSQELDDDLTLAANGVLAMTNAPTPCPFIM